MNVDVRVKRFYESCVPQRNKSFNVMVAIYLNEYISKRISYSALYCLNSTIIEAINTYNRSLFLRNRK